MNEQKTVIVVLGGGLLKDSTGKWHTIDLGEGGDENAATNDRWRVDAAFYLWKQTKNSIIASGGRGQLEKIPDAPTVAEIIEKELIQLGVPEDLIIKEEKSGTTFAQLKELSDFAKNRGFNHLIFLSNEWHLPRIQAMFENAPGLKQLYDSEKIEAEFISAEEILLNADMEKWHEKILAAREDPKMKNRIEFEKQGVHDIISGTYKYK